MTFHDTTPSPTPLVPHVRDEWHATVLGKSSDDPSPEERYVVPPGTPDANLIGSSCGVTPYADEARTWMECDAVYHLPVLDIDHACRLVPSETPGHFHLYIEVPMTWEQYAAIITALAEGGVIEKGYASASLARRCTYVAPRPWKGVEVTAPGDTEPVWSVPADGLPERLMD